VAAFEVLNATAAVRNLIRENKTYQISSIMQTGAKQKMNTLDQSFARLVESGLIAVEDAQKRAKDPQEFLRLLNAGTRGISSTDSLPQDDPTLRQTGRAQGVPGQPWRKAIQREPELTDPSSDK
jgi:twitching motility protein PilT